MPHWANADRRRLLRLVDPVTPAQLRERLANNPRPFEPPNPGLGVFGVIFLIGWVGDPAANLIAAPGNRLKRRFTLDGTGMVVAIPSIGLIVLTVGMVADAVSR